MTDGKAPVPSNLNGTVLVDNGGEPLGHKASKQLLF